MIQINKIIEIDGGTAPYTYQWTTDDPCITFSMASGTTTGSIETVVYATSETCLTDSTVTLTVIDSVGCQDVLTPVSLANKCANLTVSPITKSDLNTFSISAATPDCTDVTIEWIYDTAIYNKVSQNDSNLGSTLKLEYKSGISLPASTPIKAKVTDCNNCVETVTYNNAICIPDPYQLTVYLHYDQSKDRFYSGAVTFPLPTNCAGYTYTNNPFPQPTVPLGMGYSAVSYASNGLAQLKFEGRASMEGNVKEGSYVLIADNGIRSTSAEITFIFGNIADARTISIPNKTWNIDCSDLAGDTISLNIEDELVVSSDSTIDWSSWQVVMSPSNTSDPTLTTDINGNHIIEFELPDPLVNDSFAWVICDTDGNCSRTTTYTVAECNTPPVATNDSVTTECGLTEVINVLDNDTASAGVIDINSIEIVTHPTSGTVTIVDGAVSYTTNCNTSGSDLFTYRFKDSSGVYSNTATVSLTISCAGVASNVTLCN